MKKVIAIIAVVIVILCVAFAGDLDDDRYIEVNSKPKAQFINY